jgi:hypothetical protein
MENFSIETHLNEISLNEKKPLIETDFGREIKKTVEEAVPTINTFLSSSFELFIKEQVGGQEFIKPEVVLFEKEYQIPGSSAVVRGCNKVRRREEDRGNSDRAGKRSCTKIAG